MFLQKQERSRSDFSTKDRYYVFIFYEKIFKYIIIVNTIRET